MAVKIESMVMPVMLSANRPSENQTLGGNQ
jgi:hypothetical protein